MARIAMFVAIIVAGGVTLATGMDRQSPVLAASIEGRTWSSVYHPGELVSGQWTMKAIRPCDGTGDRWIIIQMDDGHHWTYRLPPVPVKLSDFADGIPGPITYPITAFSLPDDTPPGAATYFHVDQYVCARPGHWLFPIEVIYQPLSFTVAPKQGK